MFKYSNAEILSKSKDELIEMIWEIDPHIKGILLNSCNLTECRVRLLNYLNAMENHYLKSYIQG